jgi:uncharacterized repeat protein (TIGR01451 family)
LTYTIVVTNNGPSDASGVVVTDNLPAGVTSVSASDGGVYDPLNHKVTWNIGNLASGSSATLTIKVKVNPSTTGKIINTATVSGLEVDPVPGNDTTTQETRTFSPATGVPGISLWGSVALAVLFSAILIWLIRRRLILERRTR